MSYMTFSSQEQPLFQISEENSFMTPFLLCSYFRAHPTTLLLKILGGGRMHGPSPHLKLWGDRPPSPPRFPPLFMCIPCKVNKRTALFNIGLYVRVYLSLYLQEMVRLQCTDCRYPACMHSTLHSSISIT